MVVGLDYFGARYFSAAQGRFTSPDPLPWLAWQRGNSNDHKRFSALIANPQNFNIYAYVNGNPLTHTNPTGMYVCKGDLKQCHAFRNALDAVKRAAGTLNRGSQAEQDLAKKLTKVVNFYGAAGEDSGVTVGFSNLHARNQVGLTTHSSFLGFLKTTTITFDYHAFSHSYAYGAETVAHEGAHGVDGPVESTWLGLGRSKWSSLLATETNAYQAEAAVDRGLRVISASDGSLPVWDPGWGAAAEANSASAVAANATANAVASCNASGGCSGQP